jgi:hypothetical protein
MAMPSNATSPHVLIFRSGRADPELGSAYDIGERRTCYKSATPHAITLRASRSDRYFEGRGR